MDDRVERARSAFAELVGGEPAGVWAAPGRVNLIGEHTDYNEGFVLPIAIDRAAYVAVAPREDRLLRCWTTGGAEPAEVDLATVSPDAAPPGWSAYVAGVAWALAEAGAPVGGADVVVDSDVPSGAGVSSSAALEGAAALAFAELAGAELSRPSLALAAQRAENEVVGAPTGVMDQMAALCAQAGHALFLDCRSLEVQHVPIDLVGNGLVLLVVDTGVEHRHAGGSYGDRRAACERAAAVLGVPALRDATPADVDAARDRLDDETFRRARHVVTEDERVLAAVEVLRAAHDGGGDLQPLGAVFDASHASMRDDFEISTPELDTAVDAARAAGAWGARMTGGGFGGSAIALVPAAVVDAVAGAVRSAFAAREFAPPQIFEVVASRGAWRAG